MLEKTLANLKLYCKWCL